MSLQISYVECSNKKCSSQIGTTHPDTKQFCSMYCGDNKILFRLIRSKQEKQKPVIIKTDPKVFAERKKKLHELKNKSGLNNVEIAQRIKVHRSTVSCYLSGKYNIGDFKWDEIIRTLTTN